MSPVTKPAPANGNATAKGAKAKVASTRVGVVESDARQKTRTVVVAFQWRHEKYGKYLRRQTVLQVHDEQNESKRGDTVEITETRPISKSKCWRLVRVVKRAATA